MAIRIAGGQIQDSAVTNAKLAGSIAATKIDLTGTFDYSSGTLRAGTPSASTDVANKTYVDGLVGGGVYWKEPVRVASTANVNITNGLENGDAIDGVTLQTNDRVLLKDQSTASQNGIYVVVSSGAASRATDTNTADEINGMAVFVKEGTASADQGFVQTAEITNLGSDNVTYVQFTGLGQITAGDALTKTANTLNVNVDDSSIQVVGDALQIKASGVSNTMLAGSIANAKLANSTISGVALGSNLGSLSKASNSGLSLTTYNGSSAVSDLALDITSLADGDLNVAADFIAFADADDGATKVESVAHFIADVAGDGLASSNGVLSVGVDDATIERSGDALRVKDSGVTNAKLAGSIATSKLLLQTEWKEFNPNGSNVDFDLDDALSTNLASVFVIRNGLVMRQVSSSPADNSEYSVSPTGGSGGVGRITFGAAPLDTDDLRAWYIK